MDTHEDEPPPRSTDLDGWRAAVANGRFCGFPMETVIAAIQDLGLNTDKLVLNPLVLHASDTIVRILRAKVGRQHPNEGEDIITHAHGQLVQSMLNPGCADGKGLRVAFVPRVHFRAADAIRASQKKAGREWTDGELDGRISDRAPDAIDLREELDQQLDVELVLERIADERKRLAFRLSMEGVPLESTKSASVARVLGVSSKTAGKWIEEVRAQLREIVGEMQ
ncbi:MAG: hypothetical protein AB7G28_02335 [Pirellulales bacterium]